MDPTTFRTYLREFNAANYDALVRYYADDVVFSFGHGPTMRGRDAIVAFYRPFHEHVKETVEVRFLVMDSSHVAVELAAEFRALRDYDNFTRGPLKAGDVVRITSFVHYDLDDSGRFSHIRVGSYGEAVKSGQEDAPT
jgi:SnoaL-like domain